MINYYFLEKFLFQIITIKRSGLVELLELSSVISRRHCNSSRSNLTNTSVQIETIMTIAYEKLLIENLNITQQKILLQDY